MKDKLVRLINHIYFGVYQYTGEAFYPTFQMGRRYYHRGFWGMKLCHVMVFLFVFGIISIIGRFILNPFIHVVRIDLTYRLLFLPVTIACYLLIVRITSLDREEGLAYFEQFYKETRSEKVKWMIIGAVTFLVGVVLFVLGALAFPIHI